MVRDSDFRGLRFLRLRFDFLLGDLACIAFAFIYFVLACALVSVTAKHFAVLQSAGALLYSGLGVGLN